MSTTALNRIPQADRATILTFDAALDAIALRLYSLAETKGQAAAERERHMLQRKLRVLIGEHRVVPGDLRR